ncbi:MAG: S41 family peptidase [Planctomycetes bacterium]|nr:S41 family peptidase [Planctomycetota bacterium]
MAGYYFLRAGMRKSFLCLSIIMLGLVALTGSSCNPKQNSPDAPPQASTTTQEPQLAQDALDLQPVIDSICRGDFQQARQMLQQSPDEPAANQMNRLVDRHFQIAQQRDQKRQAAYQEQLAEIEKIKEKIADAETPDIPDVNDLEDTMLAVIRAREYALEDQKAALLDDPFVQDVLEKMKVNADADEQEGKWLDAYAHCYSWLMAIFDGDEIYQDKTEELIELSSIELGMKDSTCGETATERYEGIQAEMFLRALQLLSGNYVHEIDCQQMITKSLKRCRLLGEVLEKTQEFLAWSATKEQVAEWNIGLETFQPGDNQPSQNSEKAGPESLVRILENVLALNAITLKLPEGVVVAHFTEASLASLDPFTNLVWPWNVKDFEKSMTQQFSGIGVEISKRTGVLKVISLLPDTPAYKSGLDADDEIVAVNGEPTKEMTIYCAVSKITGPKGSKVVLTIRRPSTGETNDVTIRRDRIVVQPLRGWTRDASGDWNYWIDPANQIGYMRLTQFTENSGPDIDEVLRKLEKKGLKGLVLDLRFNSGGYLQASADVVDLFVTEGVIVKSNPRQGLATYEIAHRSGTHPDYPLVVLINGSSASASEIVAGALQDPQYRRATLVGHRSYGKGSVQIVNPYFTGGGSQLKYTIAYYHLPSNQRVKNRYEIEKEGRTDWGIAPDVEVKMRSNEIKEMIDIQRHNDVLARTDHEANGGSMERHALAETLQADPQLLMGLLIVQSKLTAEGVALNLDAVAVENTIAESSQNDGQ